LARLDAVGAVRWEGRLIGFVGDFGRGFTKPPVVTVPPFDVVDVFLGFSVVVVALFVDGRNDVLLGLAVGAFGAVEDGPVFELVGVSGDLAGLAGDLGVSGAFADTLDADAFVVEMTGGRWDVDFATGLLDFTVSVLAVPLVFDAVGFELVVVASVSSVLLLDAFGGGIGSLVAN
jgi:hypothetical protein